MNRKALETLEYHKILDQLADHCHFSVARERALELHPSTDKEEIDHLQAETEEAVRLLSLHPGVGIGGARDLRSIVEDALRGILLDPDHLTRVKYTLIAARDLGRFMDDTRDAYPRLSGMSSHLPASLGLVDAISKAISDEGEILDSASEDLARIRRELRVQHDRLRDRMSSMVNSSRISKYLQEPIYTQREGRYVLPIRADAKGKVRGIVHDKSASGATLYLEPERLVEGNNRHRQLKLDERNEERRILSALSKQVGEQSLTLKEMVGTLADFDLALARGRYAQSLDAHRPQMHLFPEKTEGVHPGVVLRLYGARHPLLPEGDVVPIDIALDDQTYALIITGPNTGGKTVTLKTVGLLACMAQTGLHIPAASGSELSLFEDVFADIGDEQSIEQSLSTFSSHITNIIDILGQANPHSLVILDELGAGTDPQEGAALARALMTHILDWGITTLVTTHHPDLKAYAHTTPGVVNAAVEFDLETLEPTYHLTVGLPGRSNALAIASRLGLPEEIVSEAREKINPADVKADDLLDEIRHQRRMAEEARQSAEKAEQEAKEIRAELADRLEKIEEERRQAMKEARRNAREEVEELRGQVQNIKEMLERDEEPSQELEEVEDKIEEVDEELSQPVPRRRPDIPHRQKQGPILEGSRVYIRTLDQKGIVESMDGGNAEVQVGNMRVRADMEDLEPTGEGIPDEKGPRSTVRKPKDVASPGTEIDLRGQRADEALRNLEYYLDKAYLSGLPYVRIIHGKGTGRLRSAVRQELKGHPHVDSFQAGDPNEGGDGVTVVQFRR
ncbi:MAG: endonuclease MutS2 [Anaerolineales bacterium]